MCHSPRPSVLLARYDITTQPTGHAPLGDPYPTDPRLFFTRSGSGLRQAIHRLGRQSPPHRNAVSIVPCCTPLWRHSWRTFSSSRAAKANRRSLFSLFAPIRFKRGRPIGFGPVLGFCVFCVDRLLSVCPRWASVQLCVSGATVWWLRFFSIRPIDLRPRRNKKKRESIAAADI